MKTKTFYMVLCTMFFLISSMNLYGQVYCATCDGNYVTGYKASAFGYGNTASGDTSFVAGGFSSATGRSSFVAGRHSSATMPYSSVIGSRSSARGAHSFVVGSSSNALGHYSYVLGNNSVAEHDFSFAIGHNLNARGGGFVIGRGKVDAILTNNYDKTLMIGFGSDKPTVFVSETPYGQQSGSIGIGNVTAPQAKLHIRGDAVEDATLLLQAQGSQSSIFTLAGQTGNIVFSGGSGNIGVAAFRNPLNFYTADQQLNPQLRMTIEGERGFVGIGTATPETRLEIKHNSGENALRIRRNEKIYDFRISDSDHLQIRDRENTRLTIRSNGEIKTHGHLIVEGSLISEKLYGHFLIYAGTGENEGAKILMQPVNTAKNMKGSLKFYTPADGWIEFHQGGQQVMNIREDKNIYVGWHDNESDIYVRGEVHAKKFRATYNPWPDYVFDPSYNLPQLDEVESFIHVHRHLPGLPPAAQVEREGFELAEMNALLLKKIEELTLYVIEQQKQINALNQRFAETE